MDTHKNAPLTPRGREAMARSVVEGGLSHAAAARQLNTTPSAMLAISAPGPRPRSANKRTVSIYPTSASLSVGHASAPTPSPKCSWANIWANVSYWRPMLVRAVEKSR